jgi:hypothetical protein
MMGRALQMAEVEARLVDMTESHRTAVAYTAERESSLKAERAVAEAALLAETARVAGLLKATEDRLAEEKVHSENKDRLIEQKEHLLKELNAQARELVSLTRGPGLLPTRLEARGFG